VRVRDDAVEQGRRQRVPAGHARESERRVGAGRCGRGATARQYVARGVPAELGGSDESRAGAQCDLIDLPQAHIACGLAGERQDREGPVKM
jgi:hypothetical protein